MFHKILRRGVQRFPLPFSFSHMKIKSHTVGNPYTDSINVSTGQVLLKMTQRNPKHMALHCLDQNISFTYQQLTDKAIQLAYSLIRDFKLKPKDRIGIYAFNKWQWYVVQLASAFADVILVNINPSYRSQQLSYTIEKVGLKVLFLNDKFRHSNYIDILRQTVPQLNNQNINPLNINSKAFPYLHSIIRMNQDNSKVNGFINFTDLFHHETSTSKLPNFPSIHDPANIQFTSGTTGQPKAATLSHFNILNNGYIIGNRCSLTQKDNIVIPVPLYHCFGMILGNLAALTRGATLTYVCEGFDPLKTLQAISKYKCTSIYGVPTMFSQYLRIYESDPHKFNIQNLRTGIIAGSLCPEVLMQKILSVLKVSEITNCYGMTQTSPVTFQTSKTDTFERKTTTVGSIVEGMQAKIVDENGQTCQIGTSGQFIIKGWAVMIGYWEDELANKRSIVDGWMKSGDLGVFDKDGYLTIVGRIKDMIIRGGENVYPKQIQEFLSKKINVLDVQIVAVSDEKFGEQIAALIKVKSLKQNTIKKEDILSICKGHIAHYKIPKYVKFVQELPLTVTGKPQKFIMREQLQKQKKENGLKQYVIR